MERQRITVFFLPERTRKATASDDRFYIVGYSYDPEGKNLPKENWKRVGSTDSVNANEQEALERVGFFVTEVTNMAVAPDASFGKVYVFQREEAVAGKPPRVWAGYTTDPLGKNLGAGEWNISGSFEAGEEAMLKPEVYYGLASEGFYLAREPLKPSWEDKWYFFYERGREKFWEGPNGPMEMYMIGLSSDPEGKNLPSGDWKFSGTFEVNSHLYGKSLDLPKIRKEITEKGYYTQWIEFEDKAGLGKLKREVPGSAATSAILPAAPMATPVRDQTALDFADKIWARLKK